MHETACQEREKRADQMPAPIKINSTDVVTPLFVMQHKETLRHYRKAIHWQLQNEGGLSPLSELVYFLQWPTRIE
jgi:hypothetical protein